MRAKHCVTMRKIKRAIYRCEYSYNVKGWTLKGSTEVGYRFLAIFDMFPIISGEAQGLTRVNVGEATHNGNQIVGGRRFQPGNRITGFWCVVRDSFDDALQVLSRWISAPDYRFRFCHWFRPILSAMDECFFRRLLCYGAWHLSSSVGVWRVHVIFLHGEGCQRGEKGVKWRKSGELFVMNSNNAEGRKQ
jgi:hypothetical protein